MHSDAELVQIVHRRARRAMLSGVESLNEFLHNKGAGSLGKLAPEMAHDVLSLGVLRVLVLALGAARGLFSRRELSRGRLFDAVDERFDLRVGVENGELGLAFPPAFSRAESCFQDELWLGLKHDGVDFATCPPELVGNLYELLLADSVVLAGDRKYELSSGKKRKQTGTFFTPRALTEVVVARALEPLERSLGDAGRSSEAWLGLSVCDPAAGGGAFLIEAARALAARAGFTSSAQRALVLRVLHGVDINPIAVAVAEAALCLFVADPNAALADAGKNLRVGDALLGEPRASLCAVPHSLGKNFDFPREFPEVFARGGFDLVIGNPPWVAYAGRAAKPLLPARKAYLIAEYASIKGYPTLHAVFVERAARIAPRGTIALVVPSPIADLAGYRAVRRVVRRTHTPCEPMLEFGQDAFASVTQPCFALIAAANPEAVSEAVTDEPFRLVERQRAQASAVELTPPKALLQIAKMPAFPRELFGEMGFQTTSYVTQKLLLRAKEPDVQHDYPLLEGRDVREFVEGEPRLFLCADRERLAEARCRVRARSDYERVRFVVRQTARYPIAALHRGLPFRNSLLAGFAVDGLPAELVVGLLNSTLYRALHLSLQRDARQAAFPQVKIAHLRALPCPPGESAAREAIAKLAHELTRDGVDPSRVERLDSAVFRFFLLDVASAREISEFLAARGASGR
ncbi:MAG TPA: N-6 DNA methylase [Polyangiaceae bacterium]|jgi:hypothetical protein